LEQLIPLVYQKLRRLARHYMANQRPDHTLQATALVVFISNFVDHLRQWVGVERLKLSAAAHCPNERLIQQARNPPL
jgi:ECF sigma factor